MSGTSSASRKILLTCDFLIPFARASRGAGCFSRLRVFLRFHHYLKSRGVGPRFGCVASPQRPCDECGLCHVNSPGARDGEPDGASDGQVEHEAGARPGSCAGYRPACRRAHARATDHARADPAADGRVDRGHLSASAQVREGDQSRRRGAPVPHRSGARGRGRLLLRGIGQGQRAQSDAAAAAAAGAGAQLHRHPELASTRKPSAHSRAPWPSATPGTEPRLLVAPVSRAMRRWSREPLRRTPPPSASGLPPSDCRSTSGRDTYRWIRRQAYRRPGSYGPSGRSTKARCT